MKKFNTTGICVPQMNYMVDISDHLRQIRSMVENKEYFTINRARQYGKTTTLTALNRLLEGEYIVLNLDFQYITNEDFSSEQTFCAAFCRLIMDEITQQEIPVEIPVDIIHEIQGYIQELKSKITLSMLFDTLMRWCRQSGLPIVMIIDEVDTATNNQVFLDFLAQLRLHYLRRQKKPAYRTFQSVILAGVTDVRNLKRKIRSEDQHRQNSPWNIATPFLVDMSLSEKGIAGMLAEYEADHHTGMKPERVAAEIYKFTSGYPFLVSRICEIMDQEMVGEQFPSLSQIWTMEGVAEAVRRLLQEKNTLFDSLMGKVIEYQEIRRTLENILFSGDMVSYNPDQPAISDAEMYGLVKSDHGILRISNIIFETRLYNYFLSENHLQETGLYRIGANEKARFVRQGRLDMRGILEKYVTVYHDLYGMDEEAIDEAEGRRRFLLYLRPVINGTGNYYIEPQTRDHERMDLVIDYLGQRFVVELKIWRGTAYHEKGEKQLAGYLDSFHLDKGYLLTYSFVKQKQSGVKTVHVQGKELVEAVV